MRTLFFLFPAFLFFPLIASASVCSGVSAGASENLKDIICSVANLLLGFVPVIIGMALLAFFWVVGQFVLSAGDAEKRRKGKAVLVYGVFVLFLFASFFAILALIDSTFFGSGGPQTSTTGGVFDIVRTIYGIMNSLVPLLIGLSALYFFWGASQYVLNASDEKKKDEGRKTMVWGIIAIFVMLSVWGIVAALVSTFFSPGDLTNPFEPVNL